MEGWELVADQRRTFADLLDELGEGRADEPTLCGHWTVEQVGAHLVMFTELSLPRFMGNMARSRFDYDRMADRVARRFAAEMSLGEIASALRRNADKTSPLPGFPAEMTLSDVTVHRQDIRRPLGLGTDLPDEVVGPVLDFLVTHRQAKNIIDTDRRDQVRLEATDREWSWGAGPVVEGPSEALMMALAGRPVGDDLRGEGVAKLRPDN